MSDQPDLRNSTPFDLIKQDIEDLYAESKNWCSDGFAIANQDQADEIDNLDKALLKASQDADALRVAEVKPLDDAKAVIQARFNPLIQKDKGKVDLARKSLKALLTAWRARIVAAKEAEARKAREEAEAAELAAQQAFAASSVADIEQREEAERLAEQAKAAAKTASKLDRAATTGTGLRKSYRPVLTDLNAAVRHYWASHRADFEALVCELARKDVLAGKREIKGFDVIEDRKAI